MAEWFVQQASEVLGPLGPAELLALVRSGVVKQDTKIRKRDSQWLFASEVGGLFEAAMRPTIENRCPECDTLLDSVPCVCPQCGRRVHTPRTRIIENTIISQPATGTSMPAAGSNQPAADEPDDSDSDDIDDSDDCTVA